MSLFFFFFFWVRGGGGGGGLSHQPHSMSKETGLDGLSEMKQIYNSRNVRNLSAIDHLIGGWLFFFLLIL